MYFKSKNVTDRIIGEFNNNIPAALNMFKALITFGTGVYVGIYVAQNYEIQRVDDPQQLANKVMKFLDEKIKDPTKK